jgi:signal transduction histidine kinase
MVQVEIEATDSAITLTVSDNGPGMSEEMLDRLFQPFATTRSNGFGLGLYSCKQIANEHNASIVCESKPGVGTAMKVIFSRAK